MAATVTINKKDAWGTFRVMIGEYTLDSSRITLDTGLSRSIFSLSMTPGYKGAVHVWRTGITSIPTTSGVASVNSNSTTYTTGTFMAIGY